MYQMFDVVPGAMDSGIDRLSAPGKTFFDLPPDLAYFRLIYNLEKLLAQRKHQGHVLGSFLGAFKILLVDLSRTPPNCI